LQQGATFADHTTNTLMLFSQTFEFNWHCQAVLRLLCEATGLWAAQQRHLMQAAKHCPESVP
jgi:hypothetical protein